MGGSPWQNLLSSFSTTIQKIDALDAGSNKSRVSLILFASNARVICENYLPSQVNTNPQYGGGGTIFDPPFNEAARIAASYIDHATIVFIFMTDGGSSFPNEGVKALKRLQSSHPNKFHYAGI